MVKDGRTLENFISTLDDNFTLVSKFKIYNAYYFETIPFRNYFFYHYFLISLPTVVFYIDNYRIHSIIASQ